MAEFFTEYGLFLAKTLTIVGGILAVVIGIVAASRSKDADKEKLEISRINDKYENMAMLINEQILDKDELKRLQKAQKKEKKSEKSTERNRIFVLDFDGDIKATQVDCMREEITALLTVATPKDEVVVKLESGGGMVHAYGLAASQLQRIRAKNIPLTISVDKVAASGGYMMSCVGDKIIAAPFAMIGSIGVLAQIPNFNRLLKKHDVDFEQLTAGEYKRTLTIFGENTEKGREKFKEELEDIHKLFKDFIMENRPQVDIDKIATGEHWPARRAHELKLVDEIITSDDYLLQRADTSELYEVKFSRKKTIGEKLGHAAQASLEKIVFRRY